jgi:hypothetical protein
MSLSLHIAQGIARRVAGQKRPAKLPAGITLSRPHCSSGLLPEHGARDQYKKARRETHHHLPALNKTTHYRVTDNEKFPL